MVLQQEAHEVFQRQGSDLVMTHKLGVTEALCGCAFVVKQLDGRDLILRSPPGNVIEPGKLDQSRIFLSVNEENIQAG